MAALVILTGTLSHAQTPKRGGSLTLRLREDLPQGFAIHESPTISTMWPAMPCFSNLVLFDPLKPVHNYSGYCNEQIAQLIEQQSQELDPKKRLVLVQDIQKKLEEAAARPALAWRLDYFAVWPYVKELYGWGRMQDVWRDR